MCISAADVQGRGAGGRAPGRVWVWLGPHYMADLLLGLSQHQLIQAPQRPEGVAL